MKWTLVVFLTAVAAAAVYGQGKVSSPPINPKTGDTTTSPPVITTTTTTEITTTTEPTTTQTTTAETTTAQTTTGQTTTPSNETTSAPTTTEPPGTTSEPTTTTPYPPGKWVVYYPDTTEPCIIVSMTMKFKIHEGDKAVEVPKDATVDGSCNVTTLSAPSGQQHLQLSFKKENDSYSVDMFFEANEESKGSEKLVINVKEWKLNYELINKTTISSSVVEPVLRFSGNMSYKCDYNRKFKMTYEDSLEASYIRLQAFVTKDVKLGEETCEEDKTNDIVPIAVGCALAALVIIVLIAYLIGRRRSRQKGYQSV